MNTTQNEASFKNNISKHFEILSQNLNGSDNKYEEIRKEAYKNFLNQNLPNTKQEDWKYTNLRKVLKQAYTPFNKGKVSISDLDRNDLFKIDAYKLVFVNGVFNKDFSTPFIDKGIIISSIKDCWKNNPELIEKHIVKPNDKDVVFTSLNMAFTTDGAFIFVDKSKVVDKPVIIFDVTDNRTENVFSNPGNLIIASENSQLTVVNENIILGDNSYFKNNVSNIQVSKNAIFRHYRVQKLPEQAAHIETINVHQENDSTFTDTTVTLSGEIVRNNINIALDGEHCETNMNGLFVITGNDHVDIKTSVDHLKPNSDSNELYKGILAGSATGVFNGKIYVRQAAQKTNAFQSNKNILLSDKATINTKPQLEIWADDVKCSHGTTTGALDPEQLFYLRSRGINEDKAKALLVNAFASEVLDGITIPELKEYVQELVENQIHKA